MPRSNSQTPQKSNASERLLDAAARVFARKGLKGATTREIAVEAGLSEMTLFRRFGTKEKLLRAVVERFFARRIEPPPAHEPPGDLRTSLLHYAKLQHRLMDESLPIIRVLLGELHHFSKEHRDVLHDVFKPMRSAINTLLTSQQKKPRRSADFEMLIDMLEGVIFIDSLRRSHGAMTLYSAQHCLDTAVEMMLARLHQMKGATGPSTRTRKRAARK
ncbi:MAG TPA: helix-turn-helix domain-containing protein [Chthoniobacterales bacterium]|nr:helix-turn-helix domain-containing protein [Chthoniobacterales bacterium]